MGASDIIVQGAREHNLCNVNVVLPRNQLICLTGVSGSGKSSLAFDTVYAEGQRRYIESLSTYARQFIGQMAKPNVDRIEGLSPSICISQKTAGANPRSTVGTITEIYDFLRVLYARTGTSYCPECGARIQAQTRQQIVEQILDSLSGKRVLVLAPVVRGQKGEFQALFSTLQRRGFSRARIDGEIKRLDENLKLRRHIRHDIELVVDRLEVTAAQRGRLAEAVESAVNLGSGEVMVVCEEDQADAPSQKVATANHGVYRFSSRYACAQCRISFAPPSPQLFSFNSPEGMCPQCQGLGQVEMLDPRGFIGKPNRSVQQGVIPFLGKWNQMGPHVRYLFRRWAAILEKEFGYQEGTVLETAWEELPKQVQDILLFGVNAPGIPLRISQQLLSSDVPNGISQLLQMMPYSFMDPTAREMIKQAFTVTRCPYCQGTRLRPEARFVRIETAHPHFKDSPEKSLPDVCALPVSLARLFFSDLVLTDLGRKIAEEPLKEIRNRLEFLLNVGLDYLTLDRAAPSLSGGEMQRIRLAGQIGSGLVGVTYILDEPSIGLHPRDNDRLLATLAKLRDQGNTVVVVEHDEDTMRAADHVIDFGPGPGGRGGRIVAVGSCEEIMKVPDSLTGQYLAGKRSIPIPQVRRRPTEKKLIVRGARHNNLKNIDVEIPLGLFVCVTGVSGSGKSSLVNDILVEALNRDLNHGSGNPGEFERIEGLEHLDKMIAIDQSPIGRTPRSNPATYIKLFDDIRKLFASLPEAKVRGYQPGRFSFNVQGGRCEACEGHGATKLEMDFLADIWVTCPVCEGTRFNRQTLQIRYKGKSIAEVLEMEVHEALQHFENIPAIRHKLATLQAVGLDYMKLGQPSPTLSGGEAQRVKLARELVKRSTGRTIYFLDEPTTGLHFADIEMLLKVLHSFVEAGNTVVVVEHNLEVIKTADWIIDLGPEGGDAGGFVVAAGTPEDVALVESSHTGRFLRAVLGGHTLHKGNGKNHDRKAFFESLKTRTRQPKPISSVSVKGARQHNLKGIDVEIPRDKLTVCCGRSGSGKSSLAMDTIYAEGQRRYVESLSTYARQFVSQMQKPKVEHVEGLSPAIAIEQKHAANTPRSTVGTVTEIYDYFRVLMARLGQPHCPACNIPIGTQTVDQIVNKLLDHAEGTRIYLLAPLDLRDGVDPEELWQHLRASGYQRVRVDGVISDLDNPPRIDRRRKHQVEVVVDRLVIRPDQRSRIAGSVENALTLGEGVLVVLYPQDRIPEPLWKAVTHSQHFACHRCGRSFEPFSPNNFSFNSPLGWCPGCQGLGVETGADPAALILDPKKTLMEQGLLIWPKTTKPLARAIVEAFCRDTGIPQDKPFGELPAHARRLIFHGTGERWFEVYVDDYERICQEMAGESCLRGSDEQISDPQLLLRFQFRGLYPTLEFAANNVHQLRVTLSDLVKEVECTMCGGSRLRDDAAAVRFRGRTIDEWCRLSLGQLLGEIRAWQLDDRERQIAGEIVREIENRVQFLVDVGLTYLTLARSAPTLSGGESQRIRLAAQVGSGLCGVLYVLDEPTIGLHPRDNQRLLDALRKLRDLGNTLLVVEHDREVIGSADHLLDFGPAAGADGGQIVAQGRPQAVAADPQSVTGPYLSGEKAIPVPTNRRMRSWWNEKAMEETLRGGLSYQNAPGRQIWEQLNPPSRGWLEVRGARQHNLKNIHVAIPLGTLTVVTGVSGSGKSSLVEEILYPALARSLHRSSLIPGPYEELRGLEAINKVIRVDQQPLGQTPTSTPATYTGVFDLIRDLFASLPAAKQRGFTRRRFSFNVPGGRCEKCEGAGQIKIEMHFLPDVWVECDVCKGRRFDADTLAVTYHGKSIADVLEMSCDEALSLFANVPPIVRILKILCDVGLGYLRLGQPANTLSGGEAQRVKLAAELARPDTGRTVYLLDEPTTGLHFDDLKRLLDVLNRLVDLGNTVVVIEHNLDVIKSADWVIDLGPEAGDAGGYVVAVGTPEDIVAYSRWWRSRQTKLTNNNRRRRKNGSPSLIDAASPQFPWRCYTGEALEPILEAGPFVEIPRSRSTQKVQLTLPLELPSQLSEGEEVKSPWETNGKDWHLGRQYAIDGRPIRWDKQILEFVVEVISSLGRFAEPDWNSQNVIEIRASKKTLGWFLHIYTGNDAYLRFVFRTSGRAVKLIKSLPLFKPAKGRSFDSSWIEDELDQIPPPVLQTRRPYQWREVEIRATRMEQLHKSGMRKLIEHCADGFFQLAQAIPRERSGYDLMWHASLEGFPRKPRWDPSIVLPLVQLFRRCDASLMLLYHQRYAVIVRDATIKKIWAKILTKDPDFLRIVFRVEPHAFTLGELTSIGGTWELDGTRSHEDQIRLFMTNMKELNVELLTDFMKQALGSFRGRDARKI
ncbi:MAG: excinuclease ABC subunit UvrA [Thermogutta sp.]